MNDQENFQSHTSLPIGSEPWFNTLTAKQLHYAEFLANKDEGINSQEIGIKLLEITQELIAGYKLINNKPNPVFRISF